MRGISQIIQRVLDFFAVFVSFLLSRWIYNHWMERADPNKLSTSVQMGLVAGVLFLICFQSLRLYERQQSLLNLVETRRLIWGWLICSLILFSATFYFRSLNLSRVMMTQSLLSSLFFLLTERSLFHQMRIALNTRPRSFVLIYGAGVTGRHLCKRIHHSPGLGMSILGFLDDNTTLWGKKIIVREISQKSGLDVLGGLDQLEALKAKYLSLEVFIAMPTATYQRNMEIVEACRQLDIKVSVVPPTYGSHMHNLHMEEIGGIPVLREKIFKPYLLYPLLKRLFDLSIAGLAVLLLSPVMIFLAIAIKMDSPGPIIFRQKRVGLNGKEIDFFKFRTMYVDANPYAQTPQSAADPRITKLGRWLRRSSLDELPQFLSVLTGDMSIVGPRPEMPFIVQTYNEQQRERLRVKPGITGIWQISAVRGEPIHANIEYDLFYIENQSLLLDIIIMMKTIFTAIRGIGAV